MRKICLLLILSISCMAANAINAESKSMASNDNQQVIVTPVHPEVIYLLNYLPVRVYVRSLLNGQPVVNFTITLIVEHRDDNGNLINTWDPVSRSTDSFGCASFVCGKPLIGYIWPKAYLGGIDVTTMMHDCNYNYSDWIYNVWI